MQSLKVAIVVPAHIPLTEDWIKALERESRDKATVIIVDDSDGKLNVIDMPFFTILGYDSQKQFLGELYDDFALMFHKCSACRVFGHIWAYASGYDIVIGLDSDCIVPFNFVQKHLESLGVNRAMGMTNPLGTSGWYSRGFPYSKRNWEVVANMGMWENVLDLNGLDRQPQEPTATSARGHSIAVAPMPFSGMNFALTRDVLFGFLFLPNFDYIDYESQKELGDGTPNKYSFRRIDDVWGGYIFQRLLSKMKKGVTYGDPIVYHDSVIIKEEDVAEEEAMYRYEDSFMYEVDSIMDGMPVEKDIETLMQLFIHSWTEYLTSHEFNDLKPAFEWWGKVIDKYAKKELGKGESS